VLEKEECGYIVFDFGEKSKKSPLQITIRLGWKQKSRKKAIIQVKICLNSVAEDQKEEEAQEAQEAQESVGMYLPLFLTVSWGGQCKM
jgi:mRNA deadenylase 3'-5' endonuclease subunit Ccr4